MQWWELAGTAVTLVEPRAGGARNGLRAACAGGRQCRRQADDDAETGRPPAFEPAQPAAAARVAPPTAAQGRRARCVPRVGNVLTDRSVFIQYRYFPRIRDPPPEVAHCKLETAGHRV
jgi:hypothetical protein